MSLYQKAVFISGETLDNDNTRSLETMLSGLNFDFKTVVTNIAIHTTACELKDIQGKYQGVEEKSFMVKIQDEYQRNQLKTIGKVFNQDSILNLDNGKSTLEYCQTNEKVELGNMVVDGESVDYSVIDGVKYSIR
jgi:hypothetical protein